MAEHTAFTAEVYLTKASEGGRTKPFFNDERLQFSFDSTEATGSIRIRNKEMAVPGENVALDVTLEKPISLDSAMRLAIREGGKTVGSGAVTKILK